MDVVIVVSSWSYYQWIRLPYSSISVGNMYNLLLKIGRFWGESNGDHRWISPTKVPFTSEVTPSDTVKISLYQTTTNITYRFHNDSGVLWWTEWQLFNELPSSL